MKTKLAAAILSIACALSLGAQDNNENKPKTVYTSPTGLRVEQDGTNFTVIFSKGERAKLPVPDDPSEIGNLPDEFHSSPNEEWIFAAHHIGSCSS